MKCVGIATSLPPLSRLFFSLLGLAFLFANCAFAESPLESAKVTQVQNIVLLQAPQQEHAAAVGDLVEGDRTLVTGRQSRAELLFNDNSIARLGANSVFSFKPGTRDMELKSGFLLLHTPKGQGGAKITTPTASAAVLGTTVMLGALTDGGMKIVVLEGTASITYNGVTQTVSAGQMVFITQAQGMSPPITVDLSRLVATSTLINGFAGNIGSEGLIQDAITNQIEMVAEGELAASGVVISGDSNGLGIYDPSQVQAAIDTLDAAPPPGGPTGPDLTGVLTITAAETLNLERSPGPPTIFNSSGTLLTGTPVSASVVQYDFDRLRLQGSSPSQINTVALTVVDFVSSGASVNYTTRQCSIWFDGFNGFSPEPAYTMNFTSNRGHIWMDNSVLNSDHNVALQAAGTGANAGSVQITNSTIDTQNGASGTPNDILIASSEGSIAIQNSAIFTGGAGETTGSNIDVSATGANQGISIQNSSLVSSGTSASGAIAISADVINGGINLQNTSIIAGIPPTTMQTVDITAKTVNLTDVNIKGSVVTIGNPAMTANVNFNGTCQVCANGGAAGVTINGTQSGSVNVFDNSVCPF